MVRTTRYTDEEIIQAVQLSFSIAQVLKRLRLSPTGANYLGIKKQFKRLSLNTSHFTGKAHLKGKTHQWTRKRPLSEILVEGSDYTQTSKLKRRLLREGLLQNQCSACCQGPLWNSKELVMILDHINGINNDNRICNLRLLCPNCASQQSTHAGRNKGISAKLA